MIVCVCHRVSDRDIARTVRAGCSSFEGLQQALGVSTACGRCRSCATEVFNQQRCGAALVSDMLQDVAQAAGHAAAATPGALPVVRWHRPLARPHGHAMGHAGGHSTAHAAAHAAGHPPGQPPAAGAVS